MKLTFHNNKFFLKKMLIISCSKSSQEYRKKAFQNTTHFPGIQYYIPFQEKYTSFVH